MNSLITNYFSELSVFDITIHIIAIIGGILLTYAVFLEAERRQDLVFLFAGACLMVYAIWLQNIIFILAMGGLMFASAFEFIEIMLGIHKHGLEEIEKYKYIKK